MRLALVLLFAFLKGSRQAELDCLTIESTSVGNISFTFGQNIFHDLAAVNMDENGYSYFYNEIATDKVIGKYPKPHQVSETGCHGHQLYRYRDARNITFWLFEAGREITYRLSMTPIVNQTWLRNSTATSEFKIKIKPMFLPAPCCLSVSKISPGKLNVTWKGETLAWLPPHMVRSYSPRYELRTCKQLSQLPDQGFGSALGCNNSAYKEILIRSLDTKDFSYEYNTSNNEGAFYFDVRIGSWGGRSDPVTQNVTISSSGVSDKPLMVFVSAVIFLPFLSFY